MSLGQKVSKQNWQQPSPLKESERLRFHQMWRAFQHFSFPPLSPLMKFCRSARRSQLMKEVSHFLTG